MNKDKLIQLIEQELVQADEAQTESEFEKHMYAIHTLTSLYTSNDSQTSSHNMSQTSVNNTFSSDNQKGSQSTSHKNEVTAEEIEAMGGKVPQSMKNAHTSNSNLMATDDNIGNGESIFDF
ncbi:DUF5327 family protein [Staphylococcus sp. HMSC62A08]|uniref:DUF5327 family protein n=1 Tax=Staphylococcus TaxID=1279 RepID=UPI0008A88307|nr:DUF5327 family protein [Staphylococcus sp. HMSC62A08]OHS38989.1 hypothetical protein HMPREF3264_05000 [Staphylococcus sp. HMSC62A08]